MRLVLNATPLIHLTKIGFHAYLEKLGVEITTTDEVLKELKITEGFLENAAINRMVESGNIRAANPKKLLPIVKGTHVGEVSVISLAKESNSVAIIDDAVGRSYASSLNVKVFHSTFLIIRALIKKIITKQEAKNFLDKMIANGWRCDVAAYKEILAKIEGIK